MKSISIQLTEEEVSAVLKLAEKESRSLSGQVRHLVRVALKRTK